LILVLQQSLSLASVVSLGHLGTIELGGMQLSDMSKLNSCSSGTSDHDRNYHWNSHLPRNCNVSSPQICFPTTSALDTLCSQSWGSGNPHLVGLHLQRCLLLLLICHIPIALIWGFSEHLLRALGQEEKLARLAAQYMQIMFFGMYGSKAST
jgi:multidrug resistance protein, MATE family